MLIDDVLLLLKGGYDQRELLSSSGYNDFIEAKGWGRSSKNTVREKPDMVISWISTMPNMDGLQGFEKKFGEGRSKCRLLCGTAMGQGKHGCRWRSNQVPVDFVVKPFDAQENL